MSFDDIRHENQYAAPNPEIQAEQLVSGMGLSEESLMDRTRAWVGRHKVALSIGAVVASAGMTLALNPTDELVEDAKETAAWVGGSVAAGEIAWNVGAVMMLSSVGKKLPKNPLKLKDSMPELAQKANTSKLFKAGFIVNTTGAVSQFVVPAAIVTTKLPPESWGILTPLAADFAITMTVRKSMLNGIRRHSNIDGQLETSNVE